MSKIFLEASQYTPLVGPEFTSSLQHPFNRTPVNVRTLGPPILLIS